MSGKEQVPAMESHEKERRIDFVTPPGIVIHSPAEAQPRPAIFAFIWGGKVAPVPALPYGRRTA
ncbi:MAG TPA: hypothetical protein VK939_00700 [Longimicrobiales bacterium]|nr:hypothetical protein [Longimicrobiales bacterium]